MSSHFDRAEDQPQEESKAQPQQALSKELFARRHLLLKCVEMPLTAFQAFQLEQPLGPRLALHGPIRILQATSTLVQASVFDVVADLVGHNVGVEEHTIPTQLATTHALEVMKEDAAAKVSALFFGGQEGQSMLADCDSLVAAGTLIEQGDADYAASLETMEAVKVEEEEDGTWKFFGCRTSIHIGSAIVLVNKSFEFCIQALETWTGAQKLALVDESFADFCCCVQQALLFTKVFVVFYTAEQCAPFFKVWETSDGGSITAALQGCAPEHHEDEARLRHGHGDFS